MKILPNRISSLISLLFVCLLILILVAHFGTYEERLNGENISSWLYSGSIYFLVLFLVVLHATQRTLNIRSGYSEAKHRGAQKNLILFSAFYLLVLSIAKLIFRDIDEVRPVDFLIYFGMPTIVASGITSFFNYNRSIDSQNSH